MSAYSHFVLRCIVVLCSLLYIILGFLLLAGAVYGKSRFVGGQEFGTAIWVAIMLGGFLAFVGLLGGCGTLMESLCILTTATGFLAIACAAFAGLAAYMQEELANAGGEIDGVLKQAMHQYDTQKEATMQDMDHYQLQLNCCGADSPKDWFETPYKKIPHSCPADPTSASGCTIVISNYVKSTTAFAVHALGGLSGLLGLGLLFSIILCCVMHRKEQYYGRAPVEQTKWNADSNYPTKKPDNSITLTPQECSKARHPLLFYPHETRLERISEFA